MKRWFDPVWRDRGSALNWQLGAAYRPPLVPDGNQFRTSPLDQRSARRRRFGGREAGYLREQAMTILKWALIFFLVSIVAGILGFTGISEASADVARFLFYVFVVIFLVLLILGLTIFRV
jgi:uncharacterized membrane protein YtjA (UPF0391 family)